MAWIRLWGVLFLKIRKTAGTHLAGSTATRSNSSVEYEGGAGRRCVGRDRPTVDDICHALEHSATENALPVEFFARVIWQESRFNARALSPSARSPGRLPLIVADPWFGIRADSDCPYAPIDFDRFNVDGRALVLAAVSSHHHFHNILEVSF